MDRLTSIGVFVRAVELGSYVAVAEEMDISPQMVGKHVRGLEDKLGVKLLHKSTRFQQQTAAGKQYYRRCKTILSELSAAEEDIYRELNEPLGHLTILAGVTFGTAILSPLLARFHLKYPSLTLDLVVDNQSAGAEPEGFDVIFKEYTKGFESLSAKKIAVYTMVACATPDYIARMGMPEHPNELVGHQCLQLNQQNLAQWRFLDRGELISPQVTSQLSFNSIQAVQAAALEGAGIAILPNFQIEELVAKGHLQPVLTQYPMPKIEMFMCTQSGTHKTARLALLQEFIQQELNYHS